MRALRRLLTLLRPDPSTTEPSQGGLLAAPESGVLGPIEMDAVAAERAPAAVAEFAAPEGPASEFEDLLAEVGATPTEDDELTAALALRDATIAGLQEQLANLRDLGDRLATTEQERRALSAEVSELRAESMTLRGKVERLRAELEQPQAEIDALHAELDRFRAEIETLRTDAAPQVERDADELLRSEVEDLRAELRKERARGERHAERAASWKEKAEERHKTAADRWREIRRLRGERRELERLAAIRPGEAAGETREPEESAAAETDEPRGGNRAGKRGAVKAKAKAKRTKRRGLADLMRVDEDDGEP